MFHAVLGTVITILINSIVVGVAFGRIAQRVDEHETVVRTLVSDVRRIDSEGSAVWRQLTPAQRDATVELIRRMDRLEAKLDRLIERGDRAGLANPNQPMGVKQHDK